MKVEFFINWDYVGLMVAMMLYPCWCLIEFFVTIIYGLYFWSRKQIKDSYDK